MLNNIEHEFNRAVLFHKNGDLNQARIIYDQILCLKPDNYNCIHFLSLIEIQNKNFDKSIKLLKKAINLNPNEPSVYHSLGNAQESLNQLQDALSSFNTAINLKKDFLAAIICRGDLLSKLNRLHEANESYKDALLLNPSDLKVMLKISNLLTRLEKYSEAIKFYDNMILLKPNIPEVYNNRGYAYRKINANEEAFIDFNKAIKLNPNYYEAHNNLGNLQRDLKKADDAILSFDKAIKINPTFSEAYSNLANTLVDQEKLEEGISNYIKAISYNSNNVNAHSNLANTLTKLNQFSDAIKHFKNALSKNPHNDFLISNYLHTKMIICDWTLLQEETKCYIDDIQNNKNLSMPFTLLSLFDLPAIHKIVSQKFCDKNYPEILQNQEIIKYKENKEKICIAYISSDFGNHPVSQLCIEMFEWHDKNHFEIIGIDLGNNQKDQIYQNLSIAFDQIINVKHLTDKEIASLCKNLSVDIAVDLNGHTKNNRIGLFSYRAAPIQVNYLGYPGTTGANYIDYIIGDKIVIPERLQSNYTEKVIYLPHSYLVTPSKKEISNKKFTRKEFNLPEAGFVFCCFNNSYKISPQIFSKWMSILKQVNDSVLWLSEMNHVAKNNLYIEAQKFGIKKTRIIFAKKMELNSEHLSRYKLADLFLDTYPYNAHTTATDALWTGVPLITLAGDSFASRVAASLLSTLDLPEMITYNLESYEKLAVQLATNNKKLKSIRNKLAQNKVKKPLFNSKLFTKNIEKAYQTIYNNYVKKNKPIVFKINSD